MRLQSAMPECDALQSEEQRLAIVDDLHRRMLTFKKLYLHCRDRKCRRHQHCVGADLRCIRDCPPPPFTKNDSRRVRRDFRRAPTKC
jgi:hypothetical protein